MVSAIFQRWMFKMSIFWSRIDIQDLNTPPQLNHPVNLVHFPHIQGNLDLVLLFAQALLAADLWLKSQKLGLNLLQKNYYSFSTEVTRSCCCKKIIIMIIL